MTMRLWLLILLFLAPLSHAEGVLGRLSSLGGDKQSSFLQPDQAFGLSVSVRDAQSLIASFRVTPEYYLYRDKVTFSSADSGVKIIEVSLPKGELKHDPNLGDMEVYHQSFQALILLDRRNIAAQQFTLDASYQGCSEKGLCYPPIKKQFNIALPISPAAHQATPNKFSPDAAVTVTPLPPAIPQVQAAPPVPPAASETSQNDNSQIAKLFKQGSFWLIVSFFFGAGLLLAFTPCMFPMVPILSGIIVGRGHKWH